MNSYGHIVVTEFGTPLAEGTTMLVTPTGTLGPEAGAPVPQPAAIRSERDITAAAKRTRIIVRWASSGSQRFSAGRFAGRCRCVLNAASILPSSTWPAL